MSLDAEAGHGYQEHEKRQGSKSGGEKPGMGGIVALRPRSCEVWGLLEDDRDDYKKSGGDDDWR
jgi:hypothetical protein